MFNIPNFMNIYDFLKKNEKSFALHELQKFRNNYGLHPDYLFLMSKYLILELRYYQSIDTLLASLKIDKDIMFLLKKNFEASKKELINEKFILLNYLFKLIKNDELFNASKEIKTPIQQNEFVEKLSNLLPGVKF